MYDINMIGERIKSLRKKRWNLYQQCKNGEENKYSKYICCKSQESLAQEIGVDRRTLGKWESGKCYPSIDLIISLCDILDCSVDYLLGSGDLSEIDPISKASYYSGISPEIIRYGLEHPDYLDCLNYFMLPENCSNLFNEIILDTWKKFQIDSALEIIKPPLREDIFRFFDEYNAITPFKKLNKDTYKSFLESKLPKEKLILSSKKTKDGIKIKGCFKPIIYHNFFTNEEFDYSSFINYLVDNTFEPLSHNAMIELQKEKLSHAFINLFTKYLEEL